jgi:glutamate 5-kinase
MDIRRKGKEVLIVTSGAIGAGLGRLGIRKRPRKLAALQAAAAVGQSLLMQTYERCFSKWKQPVAQMLLSAEDFTSEVRYRNFKNTLSMLLGWGVIPVINENDTVATEEIKVGDNDLLSAYVAKGAKANLLVILSDVDAVRLPGWRGKQEVLSVVERVTPKIERAAFRISRRFGGVFTKIQAARMASESGIAVVIANSARGSVLKSILEGEEVGTLFLPRID